MSYEQRYDTIDISLEQLKCHWLSEYQNNNTLDITIQMRNSKNTQKLYNEAYFQQYISVQGFIIHKVSR